MIVEVKLIMNKNHSDILSTILDHSEKPRLLELRETHLWDDPHISKSMLEAHLNPDTEAASRKPVTIGKTIACFAQQSPPGELIAVFAEEC